MLRFQHVSQEHLQVQDETPKSAGPPLSQLHAGLSNAFSIVLTCSRSLRFITQEDLFTDPLGHVKGHVMALNAYCHYAVIYRKSPVGLPVPSILKTAKLGDQEEKLNTLLLVLLTIVRTLNATFESLS